jgi:protein-S-isoprenylcysteine O-methyltransferase Ste14
MAILGIPGLLLYLNPDAIQPGWSWPLPWSLAPYPVGLLLIGLGLTLMIKTIRLFVTVGRGTLAPWEPPQKLVVRGIYRHVRNPMITGVSCVLLGEAVLLGAISLLYWFLLFILANLIYIPLFEEPGLLQRFGQDYLLYKQNVPRWIPRLSPWNTLMGPEHLENGATGVRTSDR